MRKTVAALYDDPESARKAMRVLVDNGFNRKRFSLITLDATGEYTVEFGEYNPKPAGVQCWKLELALASRLQCWGLAVCW